MKLCTRYKLGYRIRHHIYKMRQYRNLQRQDRFIYGTEWIEDDDLYQKSQWHMRYASRLRKLLNRNR